MNTNNDMRNLPVRKCSIICIDHPEWGTWGIAEDCGYWYVIRGRSGDTVLSKDEAAVFWRLA